MTLIKTIREYNPNLLINGAMDFWQRGNASYTLTGTSAYTRADRWMYRGGGASTGTIARDTTVPATSQATFRYSTKCTQTSTSATSMQILQKIESDIMKPLIGQIVTLSCWVMQPGATIDSMELTAFTPTSGSDDTWSASPYSSDVQIASGSFATGLFSANVWKQISVSFTVPASASKGLAINVTNGGGSLTNGYIYYVTGIALTVGAVVPQMFQRAGANLQQELSMCQRYCVGFGFDNSVTNAVFGPGQAVSTTSVLTSIALPVNMRAAPTLDGTSSAAAGFGCGAAGGATQAASAIAVNSSTSTNCLMLTVTTTGVVAGNASYFARAGANSTAVLVVTAEL